MVRYSPLVTAILATSLAAQETLPPGIWTNTEDVYFAETEGRDKAEWIGLQVNETRQWRKIDAFGEPLSDFSDEPIPDLAKRSAGSGWQIGQSELRRANPFSCWVSVRKSTDKDDGSPEWTFASRLQTFDQGGRIFVGGNAEAPDVTLRLRNVTWAKGSRNKPALVLYVHRDDPERAESYSWASPDASLVGINLRWVQGSCAKAEDDPPWGEAGRARLIEMGEKWRAHYEAGEWGLLKALYADDAVLMTHGTKPLSGRNQIITFLQRLSDNGATVRFRFEPEEARVKGALGIVTAKYRMDIAFPDRAENQIAGRSLLIYKWNDGDWRLWRDIDNFAPDVTPESFDR